MKILFIATILIFGTLVRSGLVVPPSATCKLPPHPLNYKLLDVQAHRGGQGYRSQNTLPSFANGIQLGASTLEMDMHVTKDGYVVMCHNHYPDPEQCHDTKPVTPNDPLFPYAGKNIVNLTLAQVRSLDCGNKMAAYPNQVVFPGTKMPLFREVIDLVKCYNVCNIKLNTEIKYNAAQPNSTATRQVFVKQVARVIRATNFQSRVVLQSFDWETLVLFGKEMPEVPLVALIDETYFNYGTPWLNNIDIYSPQYSGSVPQMAKSINTQILSPIHGFNILNVTGPGGKANVTGYYPFTTKLMTDESHALQMTIVPWTIDDAPTMRKLLNDGVDGIISNYPILLREVAASMGYSLPPTVPYNPTCKVF